PLERRASGGRDLVTLGSTLSRRLQESLLRESRDRGVDAARRRPIRRKEPLEFGHELVRGLGTVVGDGQQHKRELAGIERLLSSSYVDSTNYLRRPYDRQAGRAKGAGRDASSSSTAGGKSVHSPRGSRSW